MVPIEIARTVVKYQDRVREPWQQIGERGARKAALAAQNALHLGKEACLDAMERSLNAQYQSRAYVRETRPDWIARYLDGLAHAGA